MHAKTKTLGRQTSKLFVELNQLNKTTFRLRDVEKITGLRGTSARTLMHKAERRGLVTRLQSGLYTLVPFELGRETEYVGDPYVIARELVRRRKYFVSHASAMELHRMVTQPQLSIFVSCPDQLRPRTIHGYEYRFVLVRPKDFFGLTQIWVTKQQSVAVSDRERTLIDVLRHPQYAGGITEAAKALWISRDKLDVGRLVEYARKLDVGAVIRRLGLLLELYKMGSEENIKTLQSQLTRTFDRLDPTLPKAGRFWSRWRLQLNVSLEELEAVRHT